MPKPTGNLRTCTFLPKSARKGGVFVAPESKDKKTAQSQEQEYYFHIGTGQRAWTCSEQIHYLAYALMHDSLKTISMLAYNVVAGSYVDQVILATSGVSLRRKSMTSTAVQ